jgi:hypothetical protein
MHYRSFPGQGFSREHACLTICYKCFTLSSTELRFSSTLFLQMSYGV